MKSPATFSTAGYNHAKYHYRVAAATAKGQLMAPPWRLDNFLSGEEPQPKTGGIYLTSYELDVDGDGELESFRDQATYDLRFKHAADAGVIFLRTIPISPDMAAKKLRVVMSDFVEGVAGAGYEDVSLNQGSQVVVEKQYAAAVVEEGAAELAGLEAYAATMDVTNLEELKVDSNASKDRLELVISHTPFKYETPRRGGKASGTFPVLMLAGYANQQEGFARGRAEFHEFLGRIAIDSAQGYSSQSAPRTSAALAQPPASAQPPAFAQPPPEVRPSATPAPSGSASPSTSAAPPAAPPP